MNIPPFPRRTCVRAVLPESVPRAAAIAGAALGAALALGSCGGNGGTSGLSGGMVPTTPTAVQVSSTSKLATACGLATAGAQDAFTPNSAVQPQLANAATGSAAQLFGVWEQDRWNAIGARAIEFSASPDGGSTWGAPQPLAFSACGASSGTGADRASDPSIAVGAAAGGRVVLASALAFSAANYLAQGGTSAVLVTRSLDGGATWQAPQVVKADAGAASGPYYFNDRDAIAADPVSGDVYLVWDRLTSDAAASNPTWLAHSPDGGATWNASRVIYDPGPSAQTFNNQPLVLPDGSVVVVFTLGGGFNTPKLIAIRSIDHGASWTLPGAGSVIANPQPVPTVNPVPGGAPIRDSGYMAQTAVDPVSGTLAVVWQESSFSGGSRNGIALSLSHDGGVNWSVPVPVNTATGVAAFDPTVHFGSAGRIAVTYYDFRDYASGSTTLSTGLWLRQSADGGTTWTERRLAGPFDLSRAPPADQQAGTTGNALFLGDQQGLGWNGTAWTGFFSATDAQGAHVYSAALP
jgi:hypothetical protein